MITTNQTAIRALLATLLLGAFAAQLHAWEPDARELDDAIQRGDFTGYLDNATAWLNQKAPVAANEAVLTKLLMDPVFLLLLDQRQFIAKLGADQPGTLVHDSFGGGKQVYFQQQMKEQWADYTIDVPATGTCQITMKAACINDDQLLEVLSGDKVIATVPISLSFGLWQETKPVGLMLERGRQTLRIQTPVSVDAESHKRGIALKWFELRARE